MSAHKSAIYAGATVRSVGDRRPKVAKRVGPSTAASTLKMAGRDGRLWPRSVTLANALHLQRAVGNRAVGEMLDRPSGIVGAELSPRSNGSTAQLRGPVRDTIEELSGFSLGNVTVHYDSPQPARVQALAYTQGMHIYLAPGQQQHLGHEAWHVVQQMQGRVRPTLRLPGGVLVNDEPTLEREAHAQGAQVARIGHRPGLAEPHPALRNDSLFAHPTVQSADAVIQRVIANSDPVWGPLDACGEGVEVTVDQLGPGHADGTRTTNTAGFISYERQQLFTAATKGREYCQGHLLNADWGGPGNDAKNLTAFPQKPTNKDHLEHAEKVIRKGMESRGAIPGKWFKYHVKVDYGTASVGYLMKRVGYDQADPISRTAFDALYGQSGVTSSLANFRYANRLTADWVELDRSTGTSIAGTDQSVVLAIPSPLSFVNTIQKRQVRYPGQQASSWHGPIHMTKYKEPMIWTKTINGAAFSGRPYAPPATWEGLDAARDNAIDLAKNTPGTEYAKRVDHYQRGLLDERAGSAVLAYGRAYTFGRADYHAGKNAARENLAAPRPVQVGEALVGCAVSPVTHDEPGQRQPESFRSQRSRRTAWQDGRCERR